MATESERLEQLIKGEEFANQYIGHNTVLDILNSEEDILAQEEVTFSQFDLSGSRGMSQRVEETARVKSGRLRGVATSVVREEKPFIDAYVMSTIKHGGEVVYFEGDLLQAVFKGDNSKIRAVQAAMEFQDEVKGLSTDIAARVGISHGTVDRTIVGNKERAGIIYHGSTVDETKILEGECDLGGVLISNNVAEALAGRASLVESGEMGHHVISLERMPEITTQDLTRLVEESMKPAREEYLKKVEKVNRRFIGNEKSDFLLRHSERTEFIFPGAIMYMQVVPKESCAPQDQKELEEIMDILVQHVKMKGGTIDKFTDRNKAVVYYDVYDSIGDGVIRAIATAVDFSRVIRGMGSNYDVCIGIGEGEPILARVGASGRYDLTTFGSLVPDVCRLGSSKEARGNVLLLAESYEGVKSRTKVEMGDENKPELLRVKGKKGEIKIPAYNVLGYRGAEIMLPSHLFGRENELARLKQMAYSGKAEVVDITGAQGIGKSVLSRYFINELRKDSKIEERELNIQELFCNNWDKEDPFSLVKNAFMKIYSLPENLERIEERVRSYSEKIGLDGSQTKMVLRSLAKLFGTGNHGFSNEAQAMYTIIDAFATVVNAEARKNHGRYVLTIDNLQHADSASLQAVEYLARTLDENIMLLISRRANDMRELKNVKVEPIDLERLDKKDAKRLIEDIIGEGRLTEDQFNRIYEKTNGNPLFLYEDALSIKRGYVDKTDGKRIIPNYELDRLVFTEASRTIYGKVFNRIKTVVEGLLDPLSVASVAARAGKYFRKDDIEEILGRKIDWTKAIEAGIVRHGLSDRTLEFTREIFSDALYDNLSTAPMAEEVKDEGDKEKYHYAFAMRLKRLGKKEIVGKVAKHASLSHIGRVVEFIDDVEVAAKEKVDLTLYEEAIKLYVTGAKALEIRGRKKDLIKASELLYEAGILYSSRLGNKEGALEMLEYARKLLWKVYAGNEYALVNMLRINMTIGSVFNTQGRPADAVRLYELYVPERLSRVRNKRDLAEFHQNRGEAYRRSNRQNDAEIDYLRVQQICDEELKRTTEENDINFFKIQKAKALNSLAILKRVGNRYEDSLRTYDEAIRLFREGGDDREAARINFNIGTAYYWKARNRLNEEGLSEAVTRELTESFVRMEEGYNGMVQSSAIPYVVEFGYYFGSAHIDRYFMENGVIPPENETEVSNVKEKLKGETDKSGLMYAKDFLLNTVKPLAESWGITRLPNEKEAVLSIIDRDVKMIDQLL